MKRVKWQAATIFIILLILMGISYHFLFSTNVYYCSPTGSGTTCSLAQPGPYAYMIGTKMASGDVGCFLPGEYDWGTLIDLGNVKYNNCILTGCLSDGTISSEATTQVILGKTTANTVIYASANSPSGVTIQHMTVRAAGPARRAFRIDTPTDSWHIFDLIIEGAPNTGYGSLMTWNTPTNFLADHIRIRSGEVVSGAGVVQFTGTNSSVTMRQWILEGLNGDAGRTTFIDVNSTGTFNFWNGNFSDLSMTPINVRQAATVDICNVKGFGPLNSSDNVVTVSGAGNPDLVTVRNSELYSTLTSPGKYLTAGITDTDNLKGVFPGAAKYGRGGYVVICVDDGSTQARDYVVSNGSTGLEDVLAAANITGTWFVYGGPHGGLDFVGSATDRAMLRGVVQRGTMEVAWHTWSHSDLTAAVANFGTITHTGGTTKQYNIDLAAHQFIFKVDTDTFVVNLALDNSDTWTSVLAQAQAHDSAWGFTMDAILSSNDVRISSMTDTGGLVDTTTKIAFDKAHPDNSAGFYKDEVGDGRALLASWINALGDVTDPQTGLTYVCNSFAHPGGVRDASADTAIRNAAYLCGRPLVPAIYNGLMFQDLYQFPYTAYTNFQGVDEAATVQNINNICAAAAQSGKVVFLLSHSNEVPTTGTNSWQTIVNALKPWVNSGAIKACSAQKMAAEVRSAPWTYHAAGIQTLNATPTVGGAGYVAGDIITIATGNGDATAIVQTVSSGAATAVYLINPGSGYSTGTGQATSGGHGAGCTVNITAISNISTRTFANYTDWRLSGSMGFNRGLTSIYNGTANVTDFAERPITDGSGNIIVPWVSIGAYQLLVGGGIDLGLHPKGNFNPRMWR